MFLLAFGVRPFMVNVKPFFFFSPTVFLFLVQDTIKLCLKNILKVNRDEMDFSMHQFGTKERNQYVLSVE